MNASRRFLVNLVFDRDYDGYVADVPQLPGCMSQGKTVKETRKNVRKAIAAYLKAARGRGIVEVPEIITSQVEVRG